MTSFCIAFYESYLSTDKRDRPARLDRPEIGTNERPWFVHQPSYLYILTVLCLKEPSGQTRSACEGYHCTGLVLFINRYTFKNFNFDFEFLKGDQVFCCLIQNYH